jgi:hypothetical protein
MKSMNQNQPMPKNVQHAQQLQIFLLQQGHDSEARNISHLLGMIASMSARVTDAARVRLADLLSVLTSRLKSLGLVAKSPSPSGDCT